MVHEARHDSDWQPAARPEWVARINAEGRHLDIRALIPLDADHLIAQAQRNTGLSNFGADDWREPFEVLTRAISAESNLNLVGRLMTGEDLLANLEARLRIEEEYRRHPEIEEQAVVRPLFILGQPRTGTSALQNVLAADPDNCTIRTYEAWFPAPLGDHPGEEQERIARATDLTGMWNRVTPELTTQHEINATIPTECNLIHGLAFRSRTMVHLGQIPSYNAWMANADMAPALRYHARVLKLLQYRNKAKRWVLKSPDYITMIPEIVAQYPDCGLVYTHRDPVKAFGSAVSLIGTLQWQRSDSVFQYDSRNSHVINQKHIAALLSRIVEMVENAELGRDRLINVHFGDIAADPLAVVKTIYSHFEITPKPASIEAMRRYVEENQLARQGRAHVYSAGTDENVAQARVLFKRYQEFFKVPSEI